MALGTVTLTTSAESIINPPQPEGVALFVGKGKQTEKTVKGKNIPSAVLVHEGTDLGSVLSGRSPADGASLIKHIELARQNGGLNWKAYAIGQVAPTEASIKQAVQVALQQHPIELLVLTEPIADAAALKKWADFVADLYRQNHELILITTVRGIDNTTDANWTAYTTAMKAIVQGVVSNRVMVIPELYGGEAGAFAGRLQKCVDEFEPSISRTPMRVLSGPVQGSFERALGEVLKDQDNAPLSNAERSLLSVAGFSVLQNYVDRAGFYFADGMLLAETSDGINRVEYRRVLDKATRRVRQALTAEIGREHDGSYAEQRALQARLALPLQAMVDASEILPLREESIKVKFPDPSTLQVAITIQPPTAPKTITANIELKRG